jgi:hypothetical protein
MGRPQRGRGTRRSHPSRGWDDPCTAAGSVTGTGMMRRFRPNRGMGGWGGEFSSGSEAACNDATNAELLCLTTWGRSAGRSAALPAYLALLVGLPHRKK